MQLCLLTLAASWWPQWLYRQTWGAAKRLRERRGYHKVLIKNLSSAAASMFHPHLGKHVGTSDRLLVSGNCKAGGERLMRKLPHPFQTSFLARFERSLALFLSAGPFILPIFLRACDGHGFLAPCCLLRTV